MSGKGSAPRPYSVPPEEFGARFEGIFGKRERKEYVPPPLPNQEPPRVRRGLNELPTVTPEEFQNTIWVIGEPKPKEPPCPAD